MTTAEMNKIHQLNTLVLADVKPEIKPDAIYLFAESEDLKGSVQDKGKEAFDSGIKVAICGGKGGCYSGFEFWKEELKEKGIAEQAIIPIPANSNLNTYTEAESLITYAKEQGWKNIYISAPPFHQLRAFITAVSLTQKIYPELKIYNIVGTELPWHKEVVHYQGVVVDTPLNFIFSELERIIAYHEKGDLLSSDAVIEYLIKRDQN
jgi:hypothetical protein